MPSVSAPATVLIVGQDSAFLAYAAIHLRSAGLSAQPLIVDCADLERVKLLGAPALALVHWDTLGDASYKICRWLKGNWRGPGPSVVLVTEKLSSKADIIQAFAAGADEVIEGGANPRIFLPRVETVLGLRRGAQTAACL